MKLNNIQKIFIYTFLRDLAFFGAVLVPMYTNWGHISQGQIQLLQSWFMMWIFLLEIPTGVVADYLGRKYSLAMGGVIVAAAAIVYGSVPRFEIFLVGEFLYAVASALNSGADDALLYDTLKKMGREDESKKIFGKVHAIHLAGILTAALVGSLIAAKISLNAPMYLSAIPFFGAAIVAMWIEEPNNFAKTSERKRYLEIAQKGISFFVKHRTLRLLALDAVLVASGAYFVIWFYQPVLMKLGIPIYYLGIIHAALVGVEILISSNFTKIEKWAGGGKQMLRFSAMSTALTFLIVAVWPNLITVALWLVLAGGFGLTRMELMSAYMNKYIASEERATVLSSISMLRRLALVILNPIIGVIFDRSMSWALVAAGVLPLLVFLFSPIEQEMLQD